MGGRNGSNGRVRGRRALAAGHGTGNALKVWPLCDIVKAGARRRRRDSGTRRDMGVTPTWQPPIITLLPFISALAGPYYYEPQPVLTVSHPLLVVLDRPVDVAAHAVPPGPAHGPSHPACRVPRAPLQPRRRRASQRSQVVEYQPQGPGLVRQLAKQLLVCVLATLPARRRAGPSPPVSATAWPVVRVSSQAQATEARLQFRRRPFRRWICWGSQQRERLVLPSCQRWRRAQRSRERAHYPPSSDHFTAAAAARHRLYGESAPDGARI